MAEIWRSVLVLTAYKEFMASSKVILFVLHLCSEPLTTKSPCTNHEPEPDVLRRRHDSDVCPSPFPVDRDGLPTLVHRKGVRASGMGELVSPLNFVTYICSTHTYPCL